MIYDFAKTAPMDRYKLLAGCVVPRPIALVSTTDGKGGHNAAPYSFFNVMSHEPALLVLGVDQRRADIPKDTVANIRITNDFVVNLVDVGIAEAMNVCAIDFDAGVDELREAGLTPAPSTQVQAPRIAEAPVAMECRLMDELRYRNGRSIVVDDAVADMDVARALLRDAALPPYLAPARRVVVAHEEPRRRRQVEDAAH